MDSLDELKKIWEKNKEYMFRQGVLKICVQDKVVCVCSCACALARVCVCVCVLCVCACLCGCVRVHI